MIIDPSSTQNEKARQLFAEQDVAHTHDNNTPSVTMPVPSIPGQYQNSNEVDADLARQTQNLNIHDQYAPPSPSSLTSPLERDPPPAYSAQKADDAADAYAEQGNTSEHKPPQLSASELARSFNRPVPSRAAFPTSPSSEVAQSSNASAPTALILHSRTKRLADGFFCVPPAPFDPTIASLAQRNPRDHPFNQRDVREADWVTFLGALQRAATPSDVRMKSYCETIRERNAAPVVGDTMSENGTRSTMRRRRCGDKKGLIIGLTLGLPGYLIYRHIEARKRHAAYLRECDEAVNTSLTKAVDVVDTWNKNFFLARGLFVVLAHGSQPLSSTQVGSDPLMNTHNEIQVWFTQAQYALSKADGKAQRGALEEPLVKDDKHGGRWGHGGRWRRRSGSMSSSSSSSSSDSSDSDSSDSDSDSEHHKQWRRDKKRPAMPNPHASRHGHGFSHNSCSRSAQRRAERCSRHSQHARRNSAPHLSADPTNVRSDVRGVDDGAAAPVPLTKYEARAQRREARRARHAARREARRERKIAKKAARWERRQEKKARRADRKMRKGCCGRKMRERGMGESGEYYRLVVFAL